MGCAAQGGAPLAPAAEIAPMPALLRSAAPCRAAHRACAWGPSPGGGGSRPLAPEEKRPGPWAG